MPLAVITDYMGDDTADEEELFRQAGIDAYVAPTPWHEDWVAQAEDADAILTRHARVGDEQIERLRRCQVIARYGSGHDNVDLESATARGIVVTNVPGYSTEEVADHALALLLSAARHLGQCTASTRNGTWTPQPLPPMRRLRGRRASLLGCGRIGSAVATRMMAFGLEVTVYDPQAQAVPQGVARASSIDELVDGADYLSLHAPLTPETHKCIDGPRIAALGEHAVVVNVARGGLLDLEAAVDAIRSGHLSGLALDVVDPEPPPADHPLRKLDQVILTPHVAYYSRESVLEAKRRSVEEIIAVLAGEAPQHALNR